MHRPDRNAGGHRLQDRPLRLIGRIKALAKRHWPALSLRTVLFGTLLFVAALPGIGAVFLRVYENTLVQQTEAELIAQGAVLAAAYGAAMGGGNSPGARPAPEPPSIDLRTMPVLPPQPDARPAASPDARAARAGAVLRSIVSEANTVTLAATRLLDARGVVVLGRADRGLSYADLPEVQQALHGRPATVLRGRDGYSPRYMAETLSRASAIRVHHVRPVLAGDRVVGAVMLSRSPRGLFLGIYQDRGKIALGVALIFMTLVVLAGLLSRGIARPIDTLTAATKDVARGRVTIPETPATAVIEIRELYDNFAIMAERIDARTRYLRDFAAAVSHEFKTPLSAIRGAIELLDEHKTTMTGEERARFLANITADAERLSRLVQRLLDLARADMSEAEADARSDIPVVMEEIASRYRAPGLAIVATASALPPAAIATQVVDAVLTILIENSRHAGASRIALTAESRGETVVLAVTDNGSGIASSDRKRIFEPFFTSKRANGGTGLGLSIARSLLTANGASIELAEDGPATTFVIRLRATAPA